MSSRSDGRIADTPRIDRESTAYRAQDRATPFPRRIACTESRCRARSCPRFYNMALVIPVIVLAAGRSSRMGHPKALLPLGAGETFLTRIARTFLDAGVADVVIVVGHDADAIAKSFAESGLPARFVLNPNYDRGQLTSLVAWL